MTLQLLCAEVLAPLPDSVEKYCIGQFIAERIERRLQIPEVFKTLGMCG